jgi:hypothetical protein
MVKHQWKEMPGMPSVIDSEIIYYLAFLFWF